MDSKTEVIGSELKDITGILDDIANIIDELGGMAGQVIPQTANSPMESILNGLISSVMAPKNHGSTQEPQIGEIYQNDPTPLQTEDESN